nr:hypothetical protein [uncultured Dysosmobacter sp.]
MNEAALDDLYELGEQYFPYLGRKDRLTESWLAYTEALATYPRYRGCCAWPEYVQFRFPESGKSVRKEYYAWSRVHSRMSYEQMVVWRREAAGRRGLSGKYDLEERIAFWDLLRDLSFPVRRTAYLLSQKGSEADIMALLNLTPQELLAVKDTLREALREFAM